MIHGICDIYIFYINIYNLNSTTVAQSGLLIEEMGGESCKSNSGVVLKYYSFEPP